ncbi:MAG: aromatic ring-hydroxylating dioxygenase subunit alpha [Pseudomonadales bacterium]|nr:aromatic ring-hydroxylating dioxygenase subunit alpha [Pseudomonadales bacterium]
MDKLTNITIEDLSEPLKIPVEAFTSKQYAEAEGDRLWAKVWQQAGRVEEIPDVGSYITYEIGNDSILIVRNGKDSIKAFHNVCSHRGRRLVSTPKDGHSARGRQSKFVCGYHAWTFNVEGEATYILDKDDWKGQLTEMCTNLKEVKVDTWGGWIFINMDPDCEPLREFLEPVATLLDPFEFEEMRYRFRAWGIFDCNWKVALEAFLEPYHVAGTHPQLTKYGDFYAWSRALGRHGHDGFDSKEHKAEGEGASADTSVHRAAKGDDARQTIAQMQQEFWDTIGAATTETMVKAAQRLVDELPEGTPADKVHHHWLESARRDDAERGVIWPSISDKQMSDAGLAQSIFPNMNFLPGPTFLLYYRVRPLGTDPDKCIFEAIALDRFPAGEEPETEWQFIEQDPDQWPFVIGQDISNMIEVQKGMKSRGFSGCLPNPWQERKVSNLHRNLADYLWMGAPQLLD